MYVIKSDGIAAAGRHKLGPSTPSVERHKVGPAIAKERLKEGVRSLSHYPYQAPTTMPELPEVEGARRLAERNCVGKTIQQVVVADDESELNTQELQDALEDGSCRGCQRAPTCCQPHMPRAEVIQGIAPAQLALQLQGKTITAARRLGKHMWLEFGPGSPSLLLHFGEASKTGWRQPATDTSLPPPAPVAARLLHDFIVRAARAARRKHASPKPRLPYAAPPGPPQSPPPPARPFRRRHDRRAGGARRGRGALQVLCHRRLGLAAPLLEGGAAAGGRHRAGVLRLAPLCARAAPCGCVLRARAVGVCQQVRAAGALQWVRAARQGRRLGVCGWMSVGLWVCGRLGAGGLRG